MTDKKLTNEQAINVLDVLWKNPLFSETHKQAFEIGIKAIKALEQELCDKCEVGNPCLYCKHEFEPQESEE